MPTDAFSQHVKHRIQTYTRTVQLLSHDLHRCYHKQDSLGIKTERFINDMREKLATDNEALKGTYLAAARHLTDREDARVKLYDRYEFNVEKEMEKGLGRAKSVESALAKRESAVKLRDKRMKEAQKSTGGNAQRLVQDAKRTVDKENSEVVTLLANYEREKVKSMRDLLIELAHAEMEFHAKALSSLTNYIDVLKTVDDGAAAAYEVDNAREVLKTNRPLPPKTPSKHTPATPAPQPQRNNNSNNNNDYNSNNNNNNARRGAGGPSRNPVASPSHGNSSGGNYNSRNNSNNNNNNNNANNYGRENYNSSNVQSSSSAVASPRARNDYNSSKNNSNNNNNNNGNNNGNGNYNDNYNYNSGGGDSPSSRRGPVASPGPASSSVVSRNPQYPTRGDDQYESSPRGSDRGRSTVQRFDENEVSAGGGGMRSAWN